ncbi:hypothetical protein [Alkalicoccus luteus]|uniref:hypothetical protein n=1 Tax=Alkalicoccus luteus TaxID=1237094 RepID=UPI00403446AD
MKMVYTFKDGKKHVAALDPEREITGDNEIVSMLKEKRKSREKIALHTSDGEEYMVHFRDVAKLEVIFEENE